MAKPASKETTANFQRVKSVAGRVNIWLPGLLAFFLPISTSALSIVAVLILLTWLIQRDFASKFAEISANPVAVAVLAFLALYAFGLFWSPDIPAGIEVLQSWWKVAMLPVFLTAISYRRRALYFYLFLAGMTVSMLITYLAWFDFIHYADVTPNHLTPKTFHVVYNPLLAFGIYLVLHEIIWGGRSTKIRAALSILAVLMIFNMFITEGRAGQMVFLVLMTLLLFQYFRNNRMIAFVGACLLLPAFFSAGYYFSPVFKQRVDTACLEIEQFEKNPNTSVGLRLLYWENCWELIQKHPWLGVGPGGFKEAYSGVSREKASFFHKTDNPHNQYVLVAATIGIPGMLAMLAIFAVMFRQAMVVDNQHDHWQRVRLGFPLFFLTIMLVESYLRVYETAFFFALFAAVLYKDKPDPRSLSVFSGEKKSWLVLSYRANIEGSACSQHIDDRLPFFREHGIEPVLLTGPVGEKSPRWIHFRTFSLAPSGIRFELRHFLRKHLRKRWQFKLVETVLLLPLFPFYLLEKAIINLESEWSWFFLASLRGFFLCRRYKPEVIYSTGGSASAHIAALLLKKCTGIRWLAETQDPLVHDQDWQRSRLVLKLYTLLEKSICTNADHFIFLVRSAKDHADIRVGGACRSVVIYPGSVPSFFQKGLYNKGDYLRFAHFGSLAGTRNLVVFFQALQQVLSENENMRSKVRVEVYGSFDGESEREMKRLDLEELVVRHGPVKRREALTSMQKTDCLLLIQNIIFFSCETIPSKVYEYLLSGRPIIGLLYHNEELRSLLVENNHLAVPADEVESVAGAIRQVFDVFCTSDMASREAKHFWTVDGAVRELIRLGRV